MAMYSTALLLHVLAATVWTGGHLVLATTVLPRALKQGDVRILLDFESAYERIGMSALIIQVLTGLWMAYTLVPDTGRWLSFADRPATLVAAKLALLTVTLLTALDARLRVIPHLTAQTLPAMGRRIGIVTVTSVLFVVVGVSFRGGLFA
jgi:putative copper export protein